MIGLHLAADAPAGAGPPWVQILLSVLGVLGGAGGITAIATVVLQRRKFKADAADVITDTALTLVDPLRQRVKELEAEAAGARKETASAHQEAAAARAEIREFRSAITELTGMMRRWRAAILAPDASLDALRVMVTSEPGTNGHGPTL